MRVLFIGEFSGAYSELIPALKEKGIDVYHISGTDGFKGFLSDYDPTPPVCKNVTLNNLLRWLGIRGLKHFIVNWKILKKISSGYDIVQINCPDPFGYGFLINLFYFRYLNKNNKKIFLSVLGNNYYVHRYFMEKGLILKNLKGFRLIIAKIGMLITEKITTDYLNENCRAIMPMSYYYVESYRNTKYFNKLTNIVPICINQDKIGNPLQVSDEDRIIIFHGWQLGREEIKGNNVFDKVVKKLLSKYPEKIDYRIVRNVPFSEYIKMFKCSHIFIDQINADDKGINGLLGMAAGKVVFSGFKPEALSLYSGYKNEEIGVECHNDEDDLLSKFDALIRNPQKLNKISLNAIEFVKKYHLNNVVSEEYIDIWENFK